MYPPGNSSGIGIQGYGAQPTPFEALWAASNQQSSMQLMQWAALTDPTVQAATRLSADLITGGNYAGASNNNTYKYKGNTYDDFLNSAPGTFMQTGITAAAMNTNLFGGSLGQMAFGIQQMMGSGGMTMDGGRFTGSGFVTDLSSQYMLDSIRNNFFDPTSGLSNYKAQGLDKDDFGELGFTMGRRGMFAGMDAGGMTRIKSADEYRKYIQEDLIDNGFSETAKEAQRHLKSLEDAGASIDIQTFKPNKDTFKRINEMFEGAASTISEFRDIFGPGLSASAAIQEAEKLTGMSFGDAGANDAARQKLQSLKITAQTNGMDLHSMLGMDQALAMGSAAQMANMYGGLPSDYARMAAASTPGIWNASTIAMQNRAEDIRMASAKGLGHINTVSQDQVASLHMLGVNRIIGESSTAVEALFAADTMSNLSQETKDSIFSKVGQLGREGTKEGRGRINAELRSILADNGIDPGRMLDFYGGDPSALMNAVSQGTLNKVFDMANENDRARTISGTLPATIRAMSSEKRLGIGGDDKSLNMIKTLFGSMDGEQILAITENLKLGNDDEVSKIIDSQDSYLKKAGMAGGAEEFKTLLSQVHQETKAQMGGGAGFNLGGAIEDIWHKFRTNPQAVNFTSVAQREEAQKQAVNRTLLNKSLGNQSLNKEGILTQLARGFFGEGEVTDSALIAYMQGNDELSGSVKQYDITNESAGNLTESQLNELSAQLGGGTLDQALGIKRGADGKMANYDEVKKLLSSSEGVYKLVGALGASGTAWDNVSKDGTNSRLLVADKATSSKVRGKADELNRARSALALSGLSGEERDAAIAKLNGMAESEISAEVNKLQANAVKAFMGSSADDMDAIVKRMAEGDESALQSIRGSGAEEQIKQKMLDRAEELNKYSKGDSKKSKDARDTNANYRDVLNKLDGGNEFLGRIELIIDDKGWGSLYTKGG